MEQDVEELKGAETVRDLLEADAAPCEHAGEGDRRCEGGCAWEEERDGSAKGRIERFPA